MRGEPQAQVRIGQLYPSGGICDHEVQLMAPEGVRFLTTRVPFERTGVADDLRFADAVVEHSELLAHAQVDLIAINCTAATMMTGSAALTAAVTARTGTPAVTTIDAVLGALQKLEIRQPALVTPYVEEVVAAETVFLSNHGVHVARTAGRPCETPVAQGSISPDEWVSIATGMHRDNIDGILLSCAGVQIAPEIARLEELTGLPVVTSNQALLWWVLRTMRIDTEVQGYGRLFNRS